jgi:hypothetical protein
MTKRRKIWRTDTLQGEKEKESLVLQDLQFSVGSRSPQH